MVRDSFPELQELLNSDTEKRRNTRIPLDRGNSRVLRQSITNYLTQASQIQEELVKLEREIEQLKSYVADIPTTSPIEDEAMHEMESYMKIIGLSANKARNLLRQMEPKNDSLDRQSTLDKKGNRMSYRQSQYHTLALMIYTVVSSYKDAIASYYSKLITNAQHQPIAFWASAADDDEDEILSPLLESDALTTTGSIKQRMQKQEQDVATKERKVRDWHKLLSSTFQSRLIDEGSNRSSYTSGYVSTHPFSDTEMGYNSPYHDTTTKLQEEEEKSEKGFSISKFCLALILTMVIVIILVAAVGLSIYFLTGIADRKDNMALSKLNNSKNLDTETIFNATLNTSNTTMDSGLEIATGKTFPPRGPQTPGEEKISINPFTTGKKNKGISTASILDKVATLTTSAPITSIEETTTTDTKEFTTLESLTTTKFDKNSQDSSSLTTPGVNITESSSTNYLNYDLRDTFNDTVPQNSTSNRLVEESTFQQEISASMIDKTTENTVLSPDTSTSQYETTTSEIDLTTETSNLPDTSTSQYETTTTVLDLTTETSNLPDTSTSQYETTTTVIDLTTETSKLPDESTSQYETTTTVLDLTTETSNLPDTSTSQYETTTTVIDLTTETSKLPDESTSQYETTTTVIDLTTETDIPANVTSQQEITKSRLQIATDKTN